MEHNCEHVIIAGDINLKHTDWSTMVSTDAYESELLELLVQFNYQQTLANNSCMLDVFLINDTSPIIHTAVDEAFGIAHSVDFKKCSDHQPYSILLQVQFAPPKPPARQLIDLDFNVFSYHKAHWDLIGIEIINSPFTGYCYSNVDVLLTSWYEWLYSIVSKHIPPITKHRRNLPPWASGEASHLMNKLSTLRKAKKPNETKTNITEEKVREQLRLDQTEFESKTLVDRNFSKMHKYFRSIRRSHQTPPILKWGSISASSDADKANLLNRYFHSVFSPPETTAAIYDLESEPASKLGSITINDQIVSNVVSKLSLAKARGCDGIPNILLKNISNVKSMTLLMRTCKNKGVFPEQWKHGLTIPVHKGGRQTKCLKLQAYNTSSSTFKSLRKNHIRRPLSTLPSYIKLFSVRVSA